MENMAEPKAFDGRRPTRSGIWSFAIRLALGAAALLAAYFTMTGAWPAEIAARTMAHIDIGSVAPPASGPFAALRFIR